MGQVKMPNGDSVFLDDLKNSVNFTNLVSEFTNENIVDSYRISVILILARMGESAWAALTDLRKIAKKTNQKTLSDAAKYAIKSISGHEYVNSNFIKEQESEQKPTCGVIIPSQTKNLPKRKVPNIIFEKINNFEIMNFVTNCIFCNKKIEVSRHKDSCQVLIPELEKYCSSCFRKKYYNVDARKNVIRLSYQQLLGYLYENFVNSSKNNHYMNHEFKENLKNYVDVGNRNPLFSCSLETCQCEIDVSLIREKKIPSNFIFRTIAMQLSCLGVHELFHNGKPYLLYQKICEKLQFTIDNPEITENIIIPSAFDCGVFGSNISGVNLTAINNFSIEELEKRKNYSNYCNN